MLHFLVSAKYYLLLLFINISLFAQSEWIENSFADFKDGTFLDAGSNAYVSAKGRIQMITRWDFNNDGNLDAFIPSSQSHTEKENLFIYLNNGSDLDARTRIELATAGTIDGVVEDFNKDGWDDIAIIHFSDSYYKRVPVWIYLGSKNGYSIDNRIELPSAGGSAIVAGDFNNDSWIDVALACQYWGNSEDVNIEPRRSFVYWNSEKGFDPSNNLPITIGKKGLSKLAVGDIDNDDVDDLIGMTSDNTYLFLSSRKALENSDNKIALNIKSSSASVGDVDNNNISDVAFITDGGVKVIKSIYENNINLDNETILKVSKPSDVQLVDVNKDNLDDVVVANFSTKGGATWTNSPVFLSNGNGFSDNVIKLPTLGAKAVTCSDLNSDGYPEIIFSFFQITNQKSMLSYIYWNENGTYRFENHSQMPTHGSMANAVGDVNNDGSQDVVFFNDEGYFRDGPVESPLYWGDGTRNFDMHRKHIFKTHQVFGFGHADLDDDDNVDLILSQKNFVSGVVHDQGGLIIHWGQNGGFAPPSHLTMQWGYGGVRVADINRDGFLDIIAGGVCIDLDNPDKKGFPIFWGSTNGFSYKNRTVIHTNSTKFRVPLVMDLNKDGYLDIVGQIKDGKINFWWGSVVGFNNENKSEIDIGRKDHLMYIKGADFNNDGWLDILLPQRLSAHGIEPNSLIYYGSKNGFNNNNRTEVGSFVPYQNSIADVNKDGWLDLFLTSYGCEVDGNRPSLLYMGSKYGFKQSAIEIESNGSSGSEILDYDGDGWKDILICNHRFAESHLLPTPHLHENPSFIYWGSINGYSKKERINLPAIGPSGLNPRDAGNSYNRELYEDYYSSVYKIKNANTPYSINWEAETPFGTSVKFQIRVDNDKENLENAEWIGNNGIGTWFSASSKIFNVEKGKYIQYRARLITPNGAATPYLTKVKIDFK